MRAAFHVAPEMGVLLGGRVLLFRALPTSIEIEPTFGDQNRLKLSGLVSISGLRGFYARDCIQLSRFNGA